MKLLEIISVGLDLIDQLLIRFSAFVRYWRENGSTMRQYISYSDFKKAYDSVRRDVLYSILMEFRIPIKLVRLTKLCVNETYGKVRIGKHLSECHPIQNGVKQGDDLSPLLFSFSIEFAIMMVEENKVGLKLNWTLQLLAYIDDVNIMGDNIDTIKINMETLIDASKEVGLEINVEKTKYMLLSRHQNVGRNLNIKIANRSFENVSQFRYLGTTVTNQNLIQEEKEENKFW
jgi:hypothetical protein